MKTRTFRFGFLAVLLAMFATAEAVAQDPATGATDGTNEGIAVHGDWTVTITRGGDVVERREVANALVLSGAQQLALMLAGERSPGPWSVEIAADGETIVCGVSIENLPICRLSVTASTPGDDDTVVLEGSTTVGRDANLLALASRQLGCVATTAPADCVAGDPGIVQVVFTSTDLEPVIAVQDGDQIDVTVVLSFN